MPLRRTAAVLVGWLSLGAAFSPHTTTAGLSRRAAALRPHAHRRPGLRMSSHDGDSEGAEAAHMDRYVKNYLAVQASASVQYYWLEFRDELQAGWLKEFEQAGHNVGQVGWDGFLRDLMLTEPEEIVVKMRAQRPRGGSGNNPFLSSERHAMEYTVLIEPLTMAKRIMTVREQLAQEWRADLELVEHENAELLRHHVDTLTLDENEANKGRQLVFDHDPFGTKSPFRGKNYKELLCMVTKVAIRRYEAELRQNGHRFHQNWLERFMLKGSKGLEGNELLEAMLNGPMTMINPKIGGGSGKPRVIEPAQIAKGVMMRRAAAAEEFRTILSTVPGDHLRLKAHMLEAQFASNAEVLVTPQRREVTGSEE